MYHRLANPYQAQLWLRSSFAGEWEAAPADLRLDSLTLAVAPAYSQAQLSLPAYGVVAQGGAAPGRRHVAALDLANRLVKITLSLGESSRDWYGIVVEQRLLPQHEVTSPLDGSVQASGAMSYTALDLSWHLAKLPLAHAFVRKGSGTDTARIDRPLPFNYAVAGDLVGNRSPAVAGHAPVFVPASWDFSSELWTALDVVRYLLAYAGEELGASYSLLAFHLPSEGAEVEALATSVRAWSFASQTSVREALCEVLTPRLGWTFGIGGDDGMRLVPISISPAVIQDGETTLLPANPNAIVLEADTGTGLRTLALQDVPEAWYDQIVVQGDFLKVETSFAVDWSNLAPDWTSSQETQARALLTAGEVLPPALDHVFASFRLPRDWDCQRGSEPLFPAVNDDGTLDPQTAGPVWHDDLRFLPHLLHYQTGTREWARPFAVGYSPSTERFEYCDRPHPDSKLPSLGLSLRHDAPGFRLHTSDPGLLRAADAFGQGLGYQVPALQEQQGDPDYALVVAAALAGNQRLRVVVLVDEGPGLVVTRRKYLEVPEAQCHYRCVGALEKLSADQSELVFHDPAELRNDREQLRRIGLVAAAWYGRRKSQVVAKSGEPVWWDHAGKIVAEGTIGGQVQQVGTLVTSVEFDLLAQNCTLQTQWYDLDFRRLAERRLWGLAESGSGSAFGPATAPLAMVSLPSGGAGGGAGNIPAQTTAATTSGNQLTCSLYANGLDQAATATGVTVIAANVASGNTVTIPSGTKVAATLIAGTYYTWDIPAWL